MNINSFTSDIKSGISSGEGLGGVLDTAASVYGGINPVFGNVYAGWKNSQAVKEKKAKVDDWERETDNAYSRKINQDFFDTNLGSAVFDKATQNLTSSNNQIEQQAAVTGATNESKLAAKKTNQAAFGDTLQGLASQATQRNDRLNSEYQHQKGQVMMQQLGLVDGDIASAQAQQQNSGQLMDTAMSVLSFI